MIDIFKVKEHLFTPLIRWLVNNPGVMRSKLFLKAMLIFPKIISKSYNKKMEKNGSDYYRPLEAGLMQIFSRPKKILDLCTGTGFSAFKIAAFFPSSSIVAIDQITEMLNIARKQAHENNINNIQFKIGNAAELNYENAQFDLIITSNAPIYLSEAARVLKDEGLLLVAFSFSGDAFMNSKVNIAEYLQDEGILLLDMKSEGAGVYILGQKGRLNGNKKVAGTSFSLPSSTPGNFPEAFLREFCFPSQCEFSYRFQPAPKNSQAGSFYPQASHRTIREPLDSYKVSCSTKRSL